MLKGYLLVLLIFVSILTSFTISPVQIYGQESSLRENINIFHIYNETLFNLNIIYYNNTDILNLDISFNSYVIIISNLNNTERSLRWFFSQYNPLDSFNFLIEKGFVIKIVSNSSQSISLNNLENKLNILFKTKFLLYTKSQNELIYITGGNYSQYIKELLSLIDYKFDGFYNLIIENTPDLVIYEYFSNGTRKLQTYFLSSYTVGSDIYTSNIFKIDYSKYLANLTRSNVSSESKLNFYLFGLIPLNSTLNLNWKTGYDTNWIAISNYTLNSDNKIGNVIIRASKLDPFIIIYQRIEPAILNSTSKLIVSVFNLGSLKVPQVTVELNLPNWISANNNSLVFKDVTSVIQEKSIDITVSGNVTAGVYQIEAPIAYYTYNSTSFKTIGNTFQIGYKVKQFPSLGFYVKPSSSEWPDILSRLTTLNVFIINTGNYNASDVEINLDYYKTFVGNIAAGKNITYPISLQPSSFNQIPAGASVFNSITITYYNGSQSYNVKIPSSSLATLGSSFSYINYFRIKSEVVSSEVNETSIFVRWLMVAFGSTRSATVTVDDNILSSQGLIFLSRGSFNKYGNSIQATFSYPRGYSSYAVLFLNVTKKDIFIIPAFMNIAPLSKNILIDPIIITNALVLRKTTNSSIIKINNPVEVTLTLTNYGTAPIYNVTATEIVSKGWNITAGSTKLFKEILLPNESISISYITVPYAPETANLGNTSAHFIIAGYKFNTSISSFELKISKFIEFNIYKWNYLDLNEGQLKIFDINNNLIAQISIKNGKASWEGYLGSFKLLVSYRNVTVLMQNVNVTYKTDILNLRTNVFDIKVRVYDAFGFMINNAQVILSGNITELAQFSNIYNFLGIPKGVYILTVKIGNYQYSIPIVIDETTSNDITIRLPVLILSNNVIPISYVVGSLMVVFVILFVYSYLKQTRKISS